MSEEEIIKEIEIIKETQDIMQHNLDIYPPKEDIYKLDTKQLKAVICLLDLYNKEKEKNEEIKERLQEEINENCILKTKLYGESISKDKIREKIKEIEENDKKYKNYLKDGRENFTPEYVWLRPYLQELLEERN